MIWKSFEWILGVRNFQTLGGPPEGPKWVGPRWAQVGGPKLGPSGWAQAEPKPGPSGGAHAGPKWVGPSWAQARNLGHNQIKGKKISKSKSVLPKMSARSGLVGTKILLAPFGAISGHFSMAEKNAQHLSISLGGPVGPINPVWALVAIHPGWGNR